MRKSKDIKRKKREAGIEYKKGNRKEAYKMWAEAKGELDALRGSKSKKKAPAEGAAESPAG